MAIKIILSHEKGILFTFLCFHHFRHSVHLEWPPIIPILSSAKGTVQQQDGPGLGIESPSPLGSHSMTLNVILSVLSPAEILVIPRRHGAWTHLAAFLAALQQFHLDLGPGMDH